MVVSFSWAGIMFAQALEAADLQLLALELTGQQFVGGGASSRA